MKNQPKVNHFTSRFFRSFGVMICCLMVFHSLFTEKLIAQEAKWYSFNEEWVLDKRVSRYEAEMLMLAEARRSVVELAAGIDVKSIESLRRFEVLSTGGRSNTVWIEEYLNQSIQESNGKITEEKTSVFQMTERNGLTYLRLTYHGKVAKDEGQSDPGFEVAFEMNKPAYKEGDTLIFRGESSRKCWLW